MNAAEVIWPQKSQNTVSIASDIYSLGRMLKAISKLMGFYDRVRLVIKNATKESPHDRSHLDQLINKLAAIHF